MYHCHVNELVLVYELPPDLECELLVDHEFPPDLILPDLKCVLLLRHNLPPVCSVHVVS